MSAAPAAVPVGGEGACLPFPGLLEFSSSSPARTSPTLGSANSMNSEADSQPQLLR